MGAEFAACTTCLTASNRLLRRPPPPRNEVNTACTVSSDARALNVSPFVRYQPLGHRWFALVTFVTGPAMYSTMARLADGSFGILYENGHARGISFARFNLAWLGASC